MVWLWVPVSTELASFYVRTLHSPHCPSVALWRKVLLLPGVDRDLTNLRQRPFASNALKLHQIHFSHISPCSVYQKKALVRTETGTATLGKDASTRERLLFLLSCDDNEREISTSLKGRDDIAGIFRKAG